MDVQTLQKHVLTLATIEQTDAPMVSCYLNLEAGLDTARRMLDQRVRLLRKTLSPSQRGPFEQAMIRIDSRLAAGFRAESQGVAIFSRGGETGVLPRPRFPRASSHLDNGRLNPEHLPSSRIEGHL